MCGIIGISKQNISAEDISLFRDIFLQTKIRGLHATGVSYIKDNKLFTIKEALPADLFLEKYDLNNFIDSDNSLTLIGHCRYSTSDIRFNQPMESSEVSIVHNGVITQELFENWKSLFGYDFSTENDSELILHTIKDKKCVLSTWNNSSLSVCELYVDKKIRFYRNGKRPLYYTNLENGIVISSTKNILERSNLQNINQLKYNCYYEYITDLTVTELNLLESDLQNETIIRH